MYQLNAELINRRGIDVDVYFEPTGEQGPIMRPNDELRVRYSSKRVFDTPLVVEIRDDEFRIYEPSASERVHVEVWLNDKFIEENSY